MRQNIRILFFGIHEFGLQSLISMTSAGYMPVGVVTKSDAETGVSPIVDFSNRHGITVLQPGSPKLPGFLEQVKSLGPDLSVVAGYDKRIPSAVLDVPSGGTVNLHGSLLPRYRGPSTWKQAIMNGEKVTGVTIHIMTPELDKGDILAQTVVAIEDDDTGGILFHKLCRAGAELLPPTITAICEHSITATRQREELATYYGYLKDADAAVDWSADAETIVNLARALNPRPGAWASVQGVRYRIWRIKHTSSRSSEDPGRILSVADGAVKIATGSRDVLVTEIGEDAPEHAETGWNPEGRIYPGERFEGIQ